MRLYLCLDSNRYFFFLLNHIFHFTMQQLYMFYLGGNAGFSTIEVHDIQFVVDHNVEEAIPTLRQRWFGDPDKIHLDGYTVLNWADGFDIILSETPPTHQQEKLFFVYVGGYTPGSLAEQHDYGLFVANSPEQAKQKALQTLLVGKDHQHKDNLKDVDQCLALHQFQHEHTTKPYTFIFMLIRMENQTSLTGKVIDQ